MEEQEHILENHNFLYFHSSLYILMSPLWFIS